MAERIERQPPEFPGELDKVARAIIEPSPESRYVVVHGGRGSGKTWNIARAIVLRCELPGVTSVVALRAVQNTIAESSKAAIEAAIESVGTPECWEFLETETRCVNGSSIIYRGMNGVRNARSLKSLEGRDIAWLDEGDAVEAMPWRLLVPTIRKPNSIIVASFNPFSEDDILWRDFVEHKRYPNESLVVQCNYHHNHWLPEPLRIKAETDKLNNPEEYAHEWDGQPWGVADSVVFKRGEGKGYWSIANLDDVVPGNAVPRFGMDLGETASPSVVVRCYLWGDTIYVAQEAYRMELPRDEILPMIESVGAGAGDTVWSDHGTQVMLRDPSAYSIRLVPKPKLGEGAGVRFIKSYHLAVNPNCQLVRRELLRYAYKVDKATETVLPEYAKGEDHSIDAIRYAFHEMIYGKQNKRRVVIPTAPLC